jgi:hypothetical protein
MSNILDRNAINQKLCSVHTLKDTWNLQGLDKIMETYRHTTYFFINMVFDHLLPSIQSQSLLEWNRTSFEHSLVEF